ncbi:hypothetical protein [Terrarubrum flagellatum]|uniref:hypothetical protein n=1 Tax=Terrirubrum flagellatum TaxID=2895980 RepID=UPI0031454831
MFLDVLSWLIANFRWSSTTEAEQAYQALWSEPEINERDEEREAVRQVIEEQRRSEWICAALLV